MTKGSSDGISDHVTQGGAQAPSHSCIGCAKSQVNAKVGDRDLSLVLGIYSGLGRCQVVCSGVEGDGVADAVVVATVSAVSRRPALSIRCGGCSVHGGGGSREWGLEASGGRDFQSHLVTEIILGELAG